MGIGSLRRYHHRYDRLIVDEGRIVPPATPPLVPSSGTEGFEGFMQDQMKNEAFAKALQEEAEKAGVPLEQITKKATRKSR